ncbi:MAG: cupin domain-containing protein [candidate division Zixibacteria bacterium]|nr:cupin domain-containing protein [candidate division Zixibacteria bacterium]
MPTVKYSEIHLEDVAMDGVKNVVKANVIGAAQGWKENTMRILRIGPEGCTPHHQHDWEHVNYVIKGKGRLTIAGEVYELSERDFAFVPPNTEHQFRNPYDADFEFICIIPARGK